jgi:hypothetical protein
MNFASRQFLERIVTADETWVHDYETESKGQSMAWKRPTSPLAKKFKSQPSASKIMLSLFWYMEGTILIHFTPKGPDIASSVFHMFGLIKEALRGRKFWSNEEVTGEVQNWLKTRQRTIFLTELKKN